MLKKIINQLEEAKKYQIPHIEAGIEMAIDIIKQHESEFEEAIIKAWDYGLHKGYTGDIGTAQDYYNQNYKNE